jgi:hypothetical protein
VLSAGEAKKQRRELHRDIEKHHKAHDAATVRALRDDIRAARTDRTTALTRLVTETKARRLALREHAQERRRTTLAMLRDTYARERAQARETFLLKKADIYQAARDPIERARLKWEAERKYQQDLHRIARGNRDRVRHAKHTHAKERRDESDDEVRANIPADHVPLFERVKRQIKGTSRESRTEAFLRYVEQTPDELLLSVQDEGDRKLQQQIRERQARDAKEERNPRRARSAPPRRRYTAQELAEVPF